jgi:hypothetical protein
MAMVWGARTGPGYCCTMKVGPWQPDQRGRRLIPISCTSIAKRPIFMPQGYGIRNLHTTRIRGVL